MSSLDTALTSKRTFQAQTHVYNVCQTGADIILVKSATKDSFGESLTETQLPLKSFPVRFSPFERKVIERIGWVENCDILCYVSKKAVDLQSITLKQMQRYKQVRHEGKTYDIRYVEYYSSFGSDFLYVIIGGKV